MTYEDLDEYSVKITDIPEYAAYYMCYGESDSLTEDDIKIIDNFMEKNNLSHLVDISENKNFVSHPAFGLACDCYDYAIFAKRERDIIKESGNDIEATFESPEQQKHYYYNPYSQEYLTIAFEDNDWHTVFYDKDYNVLSDDVGFTVSSPKDISEVLDTVLEMRYHIDNFAPEGMTKPEYEAIRAEKEHYLSKNWTIWTDVEKFEEIIELKIKTEQEKELNNQKDFLTIANKTLENTVENMETNKNTKIEKALSKDLNKKQKEEIIKNQESVAEYMSKKMTDILFKGYKHGK